jgi:hypothetical protein
MSVALDPADASADTTAVSVAALRDLRRTRQQHRLGNLDWFEAMYRVYLVGGFGGGAVLWISSSVKDEVVGAGTLDSVTRHGPAVLGLLVAFAFMAGVRGGAQGGPLALEAPDVAYVMLAPIDRMRALLKPAAQRLRSACFTGALTGAIVGQLAGRRLPGSLLAWAAGGALFGATAAALWVAVALLAHTLRLPRWMATVVGLAAVGWQAAAVAWHVPGPFDLAGSLGLWGWRQHPIDLLAVAVAVAACVAGFAMLRRISLDALARRSALVAQLKFAVTMQDLRTVILLRRQLNQEITRSQPYVRLRTDRRGDRSLTASLWRRGWHGLLRFPIPRVARMSAVAAAMGVTQAMVVRGTSPAFLATAILGFVLGLEVMEPLSQEVDQADRADALPIERGELMMRHLLAPVVALVPFGIVAGLAAFVTLGGNRDALVPIAILCVPTVIGAAAGGVVSIVKDMPDPFSSANQQAFVPPEMAGFTTTIRLIWPIVVSAATTCTVLLPRSALRLGQSIPAAAVRGALGALLVAALVGYWVKVRDRLRQKIRAFMEEGRAYSSTQRSSAAR